jgi:hypothetical protein
VQPLERSNFSCMSIRLDELRSYVQVDEFHTTLQRRAEISGRRPLVN